MTEHSARTVANVVLAAAAVGTAYVVLRNPPLRRLAWSLAVAGLTRQLPQWLSRELRTAWEESGSVRRPGLSGPA